MRASFLGDVRGFRHVRAKMRDIANCVLYGLERSTAAESRTMRFFIKKEEMDVEATQP